MVSGRFEKHSVGLLAVGEHSSGHRESVVLVIRSNHDFMRVARRSR